ncbi:MAG: nitroreductase family protein [Omnitrophica WOR_2 bacterium]
MDVFDAVRTVLAVRKYQDTPVPPDIIWRIVEAGRLTASASNRQPWHFVVVQDRDTLRKIGQAAKTGPYIAQAPLAIVVAVDKSNKFGVSDGSRAVQSMILAAWAEGIGSNWVGYLGPDEVKPLVGIPNHMDILAILPFGFPAQPTGHGKKNRKPLNEVASRERFGQSFE